jgi:hypothetical protein
MQALLSNSFIKQLYKQPANGGKPVCRWYTGERSGSVDARPLMKSFFARISPRVPGLCLFLLVSATPAAMAAAPAIPAHPTSSYPPSTGGVPQPEVPLEIEPHHYKKGLHQVLCSERYKGKGVFCFQSKGDGKLNQLSGRSLPGILKRNRLFGVPLVFIWHTGRIQAAYLEARQAPLMRIPIDLLAEPDPVMPQQSWWVNFQASLDDAYWLEFEQEILSLYAARFEPAARQALKDLRAYEVLSDQELDQRFTFSRVLEDATREGAAPPMQAR